jgi:gamma-glutamyltranspeptidase / glutathione hydrolase
LWELPPNGQGVAALEMLRILEGFDLRAMGHNSPPYLHHLIEAKKLAFADIDRHVAEPASMTVKPERLLSDEFIEGRRARIDAGTAAAESQSGFLPSETVYLTTADSQGNMVSFINSIFDCFGSGIVAPGSGFALQNRGSGFSLEAGHPNMVAPGKRPRHTIIPAFVTRSPASGEEPWLSFGVMGGPMQPQGHVQVLLNMLLFGMDPQQAIDAPRFRHVAGRQVLLEREISRETVERLGAMGHEADYPPPGPQMFGGGQAILRTEDGYVAGSDGRKDGVALGY